MELALDPEGRQSAFEVEVRPGRVRAGELSAVDVVIVAGWQNPDAATARQLAQFVRDGGGLWILLDDRTDLGRLSRTLLAEVGFAPLADERGRSNSVTQWEDMDLDHPALRSLFDGEGQYDRPAVGRLYTAHAGKGGRAIIRVSDGRPFLLERSLGSGRAWLIPSAANRSWTDWPISGVFAPLVQQGFPTSQGMRFMEAAKYAVARRLSGRHPSRERDDLSKQLTHWATRFPPSRNFARDGRRM